MKPRAVGNSSEGPAPPDQIPCISNRRYVDDGGEEDERDDEVDGIDGVGVREAVCKLFRSCRVASCAAASGRRSGDQTFCSAAFTKAIVGSGEQGRHLVQNVDSIPVRDAEKRSCVGWRKRMQSGKVTE